MNKEFIDISTFYMSAKFFNGKVGEFIPMINESQATLVSKFNFSNPAQYFYYRVELDYSTKTYQVFKDNIRIGTGNNSIKWYEYVNP